ncbi:MAG: nucleotide sugar dehydrogenase [Alphaproteobacteria bacterium]|nr:nucleotide sugar dehydrogenase [Alphaproteobacteria bacterium]
MSSTKIAVVGLGYVGLPLAVALARKYLVIGFDIDERRIAELKQGHDRTGEVEQAPLRSTTAHLTAQAKDMAEAEIFIVTVPTPVTPDNLPDLGAVLSACRTVGQVMKKGAVVVFESTVYPGVTEDICGPELEKASGLACGKDFFLGYSPERINPGDREHTVDRITKVVAGQTPEIARKLCDVYGSITTGGTFLAASIKAAEASKVIENAQRDINIAFINEVTMIFSKLGISIHDVLEASGTKWNFLKFQPGLVGGHCIGVDPFYLAHCALQKDHHPEVILAGRKINDSMGGFIASEINAQLKPGSMLLVLGLTFKENVPDLRNSKVIDVIRGLRAFGHSVDIHDPLADPEEARHEYGLDIMPSLDGASGYHALIGAVAHDSYAAFGPDSFLQLLQPDGLVADIKGMWRKSPVPDGLKRWML